MKVLRYTLLSDGSSDAALLPIIEWLIGEHRPDLGVLGQLAGGLETNDRSLVQRVPAALRAYPCDFLFVHRDAEGESMEVRLREIDKAKADFDIVCIPIIPVKMTEAWLLSDEMAIRSAAENRNGTMGLGLPGKRNWESLPDPKGILFESLVIASGKQGRALAKFNPHRQRPLVAQRTSNFVGLRGVPSFDFFEAQLIEKLKDF
jgi:hypothetical protein